MNFTLGSEFGRLCVSLDDLLFLSLSNQFPPCSSFKLRRIRIRLAAERADFLFASLRTLSMEADWPISHTVLLGSRVDVGGVLKTTRHALDVK